MHSFIEPTIFNPIIVGSFFILKLTGTKSKLVLTDAHNQALIYIGKKTFLKDGSSDNCMYINILLTEKGSQNLEFYFSGQGFETIVNQFMLGSTIMVAPMLEAENCRKVVFPNGKWIGDYGTTYAGGKAYNIDVPID